MQKVASAYLLPSSEVRTGCQRGTAAFSSTSIFCNCLCRTKNGVYGGKLACKKMPKTKAVVATMRSAPQGRQNTLGVPCTTQQPVSGYGAQPVLCHSYNMLLWDLWSGHHSGKVSAQGRVLSCLAGHNNRQASLV